MTVDLMKFFLFLLCLLLLGMLFVQYKYMEVQLPLPPPYPAPVEPLTPPVEPRPILQIPVEPYRNVKITRLGIRRNPHRDARHQLPSDVF